MVIKKKGVALIISIAVISIIFVLAASLITAVSASYISTIRYSNSIKLKLVCESGVEKGIAQLKTLVANKGTDFVNPQPYDFKDANNIPCDVVITQDPSDLNHILINSSASFKGLTKNIKIVIDKNQSFTANYFINSISQNALSIFDKVDSSNSSFTCPDTSKFKIDGSVYLQGGKISFRPYSTFFTFIFGDYTVNGGLTIKATDLILDMGWGLVLDKSITGDISVDSNNSSISPGGGLIPIISVKKTIKEINMLSVNDININSVNKVNDTLLIYNTSETNFEKINTTLNNYISSHNLNTDSVYKLVISNFTVNMSAAANYKNYIIYCNNKLTINSNGDVKFYNSSICAKQMEITNSYAFYIQQVGINSIGNNLQIINTYLQSNLTNFYDLLNVKIISWTEK